MCVVLSLLFIFMLSFFWQLWMSRSWALKSMGECKDDTGRGSQQTIATYKACSSVVRAADCRSAGHFFKSAWAPHVMTLHDGPCGLGTRICLTRHRAIWIPYGRAGGPNFVHETRCCRRRALHVTIWGWFMHRRQKLTRRMFDPKWADYVVASPSATCRSQLWVATTLGYSFELPPPPHTDLSCHDLRRCDLI